MNRNNINEESPLSGKKKRVNRKYKNKFLLIGFKSEMNQIKLDENTLIRRGGVNELKEFYDRFNLGGQSLEYVFFLEHTYHSNEQTTFPPEIEQKEREIRLFFDIFFESEVKSPFCFRYIFDDEQNVFMSIGSHANSRISNYSDYVYELTREKLGALKKNWKQFIEIESSTFKIALKRYYYSKSKYDQEDRIIDLMIAFEALFILETNEITSKLANRVAAILTGYYDYEILNELIKKSYNLRSRIVHGSELKNKDLTFNKKLITIKDFNETLSKILSEVLFLQLTKYGDLDQSKFIKYIDSQIDKEKSS